MQAKTGNGSIDLQVRRRLRELRMQRGMTLQEVGERAGIDVSTLSRLEAGKRRLALDHLRGWPKPSRSAPTSCYRRRRRAILGCAAPRTPTTQSRIGR
jgi:hypothetical protein